MSQAIAEATPVPAPDEPLRQPDGTSSRRSLALFMGAAVVLWITVWLASSGGGLIEPARPESFFDGTRALAGWVHWDGEWYRRIAEHGYFFSTEQQSSVAFFPAYPLLLRGLSRLGGDVATWGIVVTVACGAAISLLFPDWCRRVGLRRSSGTAVAVFFLWPYAWFLYGAVYSDAMFVAFAIGAFVLLERDRPVAAGILGAIATATRPVGIAVIVGLAVRSFERRRSESDGGFRRRDAGVLIAAVGLLAYVTYLWRRFDEPLAFAKAETAPGWENTPSPHTWFKHAAFERLVHLPDSGTQYFAGIALQALLAIALLTLVPLIVRRIGYAYGLYTLMIVGIPLLESKDFQGLGRYCLAAFPAFAVLGDVLAGRPRARTAWLAVSAGGLVFLAGAYARGRYLA